MKKKLLIVSALLVAFAAQAQTGGGKRVQFGIKAGANFANLKNEQGNFLPVTESRTGYHAGLLAHIHVTRGFAVQPEVVYSSQGTKAPDAKYIINSINIPVLAQFMFGEGLRLQTGPQVGLLLNAHTEDAAGNENPGLKTFLQKADFAWSVGAGYILPAGLGIDARYNHGLSNIRDEAPDVVRSRVWQVGIFYQFR